MGGSGRVTTFFAVVVAILALLVVWDDRSPTPAQATDRIEAGSDAVDSAAERADGRIEPYLRRLAPGERPPQFVLFSFDGAGSHEHWQRFREAAARSEARITGFLSGTYLLTDAEAARYTGPGHRPGQSSIGFGGTPEDVARLVADLNLARDLGHEIGTHYNGHFCAGAAPSGRDWSQAMWADELGSFRGFVESARANLGLRLEQADVRGGRTPCLEGDWAQAFPAMAAAGLRYDTSQVTRGITWPTDVVTPAGTIREYGMPTVTVPALGRKVVLMDYNLWYVLNGARDQPARAAEFAQVTLGAYRAAYESALAGNRAPLVVGNHFNTWSGGGFSQAVEEFMGEVCLRPETVCATYSQVDAFLDLQDPAVVAGWRAMDPTGIT
ncbi:polysaccharide deacetylase [Pseudonocardia pini]|uniref:polysaccharide deacetylase n=1 Tax=Pseudonocardia pini TaxID=2758030 RepID=UPI0015F0D9F5|nr:polysaccharide deacetylase [Pseudonocardia pini]